MKKKMVRPFALRPPPERGTLPLGWKPRATKGAESLALRKALNVSRYERRWTPRATKGAERLALRKAL